MIPSRRQQNEKKITKQMDTVNETLHHRDLRIQEGERHAWIE